MTPLIYIYSQDIQRNFVNWQCVTGGGKSIKHKRKTLWTERHTTTKDCNGDASKDGEEND